MIEGPVNRKFNLELTPELEGSGDWDDMKGAMQSYTRPPGQNLKQYSDTQVHNTSPTCGEDTRRGSGREVQGSKPTTQNIEQSPNDSLS